MTARISAHRPRPTAAFFMPMARRTPISYLRSRIAIELSSAMMTPPNTSTTIMNVTDTDFRPSTGPTIAL